MAVLYALETDYVELPIETVYTMITLYFFQDFCKRFKLLQRLQSRYQAPQPVWEQYYDCSVALHLGQLSNLFDEGQDEKLIFSQDGQLFYFSMIIVKD